MKALLLAALTAAASPISFTADKDAITSYSEILKTQPDNIPALFRRGVEYFRAAKMSEAIADLERVAQLQPERAPELWQLGICYYYAGQFEKGRKLFESHQTVNSNDVENAVWHFLCVARAESLAKAREKLIPISGDARVPMAQIHSLFGGKGSVQEVLEAAKSGGPGAGELNNRLCYAHLYLALFEEANGNSKESLEHIRKAAGEFAQKHYMGEVARVHLTLRTSLQK